MHYISTTYFIHFSLNLDLLRSSLPRPFLTRYFKIIFFLGFPREEKEVILFTDNSVSSIVRRKVFVSLLGTRNTSLFSL